MFDQKLEKYFDRNNKTDGQYSVIKGIKLAQDGKLMEAAMQFKTVLAAEPDSIDILYNYGKVCYAIYTNPSEEQELKKDFKEVSLKLFEMCVDKHPDFPGAYYYLGFFYLNGGLYQKCSLIWQKYVELATCKAGHTDKRTLRTAKTEESTGAREPIITEETEEVKEIRERLVQIDNLVRFEQGYLAVIAGRADEGIAILEPLMQKDPQGWNILFFLGLAYRKKGEYEKAAGFFQKVMAQIPSQADAMNEFALCCAGLGHIDKSEKYFKKALLIRGENPEILCNLAGLYVNAGRLSDAEECLDKAHRISPDDEIIRRWQNEIEKRKGSR